jgi:RNA polymerase sigma factor (TIGR02999 family)
VRKGFVCHLGNALNGQQSHNVEELLQSGCSDPAGLAGILPAVYDELRRLAHSQLHRERTEHTLNTTALVHETYLRLAVQSRFEWKNRGHFFGAAARMMRRILVDHARSHGAEKRGGPIKPQALDAVDTVGIPVDNTLLLLNNALDRLAELDPRQAQIVELRYFAGLSIVETAEALDISPSTVKNEWTMAKAWLRRELSE